MRIAVTVALVLVALGALPAAVGIATSSVPSEGSPDLRQVAGPNGYSSTPPAESRADPVSQSLERPTLTLGDHTHTLDDETHACPATVATPYPSTADNASSATGPGAANRSPPFETPAITAVYPNPTTEGNVGEYAVLTVPGETRLENWTVTDGHTTATLPNVTIDDRVAVTMDPERTASMTDLEPIELEGHLRLAADGDELTLLENGTKVDSVAYDRARTATKWHRVWSTNDSPSAATGSGGDRRGKDNGTWWPREATCFPVGEYDATGATAFVLPDGPEVAVDHLDAADDRILLAGYTFTSMETADALVDALERGVDVEILVEAGPVGGTPEETDDHLSRLEEKGATVSAVGGPGSRYRFHHPKYAVADDAVLVTSENWSPAGLGGASSRGWGVVVEDPALATDLEAVFRADADGWDVTPWSEHRQAGTFVDDDAPSRSYPTSYEPATVEHGAGIESVELLVAPDNAEVRLLELIAESEDEILIKQAAISDPEFSLLEAAVDAAERGVDVRILLDATWYHEADNEAVVRELERVSAAEGLSLEARLVAPSEDFEKIHAKGVIVDGETAVVGSVNWNDNSLRNNREVVLALHGEGLASYYRSVFEADWEADDGAPLPIPLELLGAVGAGLVATVVLAWHRLRFDDVDRTEDAGDDRLYFETERTRLSRRHSLV